MGDSREIQIGIDYYRIAPNGVLVTTNRPGTVREWCPVRDAHEAAVREVLALRDEVMVLRAGIDEHRDAAATAADDPLRPAAGSMNIAIGDRRYVLEDDGTIRKTAPSPIMDGAEEAAVRELARMRGEWHTQMQRYHAIRNQEIPALNRQICQAVRETLSGYFTVRQLGYILGPAFGANWDALRDVAVSAGLHDYVARYDALLNEAQELSVATRDVP